MSVETDNSSFWVVGHRGSPLVEVENTLPSFERALLEGANGLELDLCVTRDAEVIVWHDYDPSDVRALGRRWGWEPLVRCRPVVPDEHRFRKPTSELSWAEFRERFGYAERKSGQRIQAEVPTLGRFMEWAVNRSEVELVFLDIKLPNRRTDLVPRLLARLDAVVQRLRPRFRIVLESCERKIVSELARLAPQYESALDVEPHAGLVFDLAGASAVRAAINHHARHAMPQKPRRITLWPFATHRRIVARDLELMRRHNAQEPEASLLSLCPFTINAEPEMRALIELGVSGILSDVPALLHRVALESGRSVRRAKGVHKLGPMLRPAWVRVNVAR